MKVRAYIVRTNTYRNFISHEIFMNDRVEYCYYEKVGNSFVNQVYIIVGNNSYVNQLLENSIYVFCQDVNRVSGIVSILKEEFLNLKFIFVLCDPNDSDFIRASVLNLGITDILFVSLDEYLKKSDTLMKESSNYYQNTFGGLDSLAENSLNKNEKENWTVDKNFADYKGYNERLIDKNVKNIVQLKKGNGGHDEL